MFHGFAIFSFTFIIYFPFIFSFVSFFFTESWDVYQGVVSKYFLLRGFQRLPLSYTLTNLRKNKFFKTKMRLYERRKIELNSRDRFVFDCRFVDDCSQEYCRLFVGVLQVVCSLFEANLIKFCVKKRTMDKPTDRPADGQTDSHIEKLGRI